MIIYIWYMNEMKLIIIATCARQMRMNFQIDFSTNKRTCCVRHGVSDMRESNGQRINVCSCFSSWLWTREWRERVQEYLLTRRIRIPVSIFREIFFSENMWRNFSVYWKCVARKCSACIFFESATFRGAEEEMFNFIVSVCNLKKQ